MTDDEQLQAGHSHCEAPFVVFGESGFECLACEEKRPLSFPIDMNEFVEAIGVFVARHKDCASVH